MIQKGLLKFIYLRNQKMNSSFYSHLTADKSRLNTY